MNRAFLCLGGNLGNRLENIENALKLIEKKVGNIIQTSNIYETQAWGSTSKNNFLNLCVEISTKMDSQTLLKTLLIIEKKLGRSRGKNKNADRTMDIDILLFNNEIIENKLVQIPHPRLHLRKFVLVPLNEIAPKIKHPVLKKTISALLKDCKDNLYTRKYETRNKIICIEGNIGSGKTTLAKELAKQLNAVFVQEHFENNPLLPLFYKNPKKYAAALETSFLIERFNQLKMAFKKKNISIVCDHSIYKCLWFAKANLTVKDFNHFEKKFHLLASELPSPNLIIYLKTNSANLKQNIKKRGRDYEQKIRNSYLNKIDKEYLNGLKSLKQTPQLHFEISSYKNSTNSNLIKEIKKYLKKIVI